MRRRGVLRSAATAMLIALVAGGCSTSAPDYPAHAAPGEHFAANSSDSWFTYHKDAARTGYDGLATAASGHLSPAWARRLDGAVYGEPLVVNGDVIVATEHNSVYALTPRGRILWRRHLGAPVPLSALPCGDIDPLGITGTPVYDPKTGRLYVAAELAGPIRHRLFALNPQTGHVAWSHPLDPARMHRHTQQQRAALAIANGRVWVAFGGLAGDCGRYHGWLIGVRAAGGGKLSVYRTPSRREAGIWAPSGPAVDSSGHLYVSVGNGAATAPPYDKSDSILRLLGNHVVSFFAPTGWAAENQYDKDLGSTGPAIVRGAGHRWIFADGKGGTGYLLHPARLGGIGGQAATLSGCTSFGGTAFHRRTIYVPCSDGLRAVRIRKGPRLRVVWHSTATSFGSAPVLGGGAVWALNGVDKGNNRLLQINPRTGHTVTSIAIPAAPHFATPTLHGSLVLIGTNQGVAAVRTS